MVQGEGVLALFLFNFFKVFHFYIYKLLYPLQNVLCIQRKTIFFCYHNFMKKSHLKLPKTDLKISYKLR